MIKKKVLKISLFLVSLWVLGICYYNLNRVEKKESLITKSKIAESLTLSLNQNFFPAVIEVYNENKKIEAIPNYTLDTVLQNKMEKIFKKYQPDYGAFIALDARTGEILVFTSFSKKKAIGNLNFKATFPAASVFKVVTATAAIDQDKAEPETVISFSGRNHTLYKRNIAKDDRHGDRKMTLKEAFAKSINSVFGKIGVFKLSPSQLKNYAERFLFNKKIPSDLPVDSGTFKIEEGNNWQLAEIASGFSMNSQMSPLQGALIASSIVNEGVMMEPFVVKSLKTSDNSYVYLAESKELSVIGSKEAADKVRKMMIETVKTGTSSKVFRGYFKKNPDIEVGGKTGSLTGNNPKGKYDWFIGYGIRGDSRIAIAALTINEDVWQVKSTTLARQFFEAYYR